MSCMSDAINKVRSPSPMYVTVRLLITPPFHSHTHQNLSSSSCEFFFFFAGRGEGGLNTFTNFKYHFFKVLKSRNFWGNAKFNINKINIFSHFGTTITNAEDWSVEI